MQLGAYDNLRLDLTSCVSITKSTYPQGMLHSLVRLTLRPSVSHPVRSALQQRSYAAGRPAQQSSHRPGGQGEPIKWIPLVAIFVIGSGAYVLMVKKRAALEQKEISGETRKTGRYQRSA
jgi:hypothetical protein